MSAEIIMKLESDAIPGSGTSVAGVVDRDIMFDANGVPYIPAKRLKGIMREAAEELNAYGTITTTPDEIFGVEHASTTCGFVLGNGLFTEHSEFKALSDWAAGKPDACRLINPHKVLQHFAYTRSQTAIETENGIAKRNSLRMSRVLRKGLEFRFPVQCEERHAKDLETICRAVRAFGSSRTR